MKKILGALLVVVILVFLGVIAMAIGGVVTLMSPPQVKLNQPSILHLELEGVIADGKEFLELLRKNVGKEEVKGVLVSINSPGGVVGPSQEIYEELKRVREELNKPVVATCSALAASGAYYAAIASDKIVANAGTLMGSIGVIMEFANLEKLYEWAKMDFYVLKTGQFKDAGSPFRPMKESEKQLFQNLIDEVHGQFKTAVMESRKLSRDVVDKYADGRVFNGETAVKLGFADEIGTFEDARRMVGEMAGLGKDPNLYKPRVQPESLMEFLEQMEGKTPFESLLSKLKAADLAGRPLSILPQAIGL